MNNNCTQWKDALLEAALSDRPAAGLEQHLSQCSACAANLATLRARRERLDALLPLAIRGPEPSAGFHGRIMNAAESAGRTSRTAWPAWGLAAAAILLIVFGGGPVLRWFSTRTGPDAELAAATRLANWRAPSDALLAIPGREILSTTPRLGESYPQFQTDKEKQK
jgi:anti-sigma factor RsiW